MWNNDSTKVAIPFWTTTREQKTVIVDVVNISMEILLPSYNVLCFEIFEEGILSGVDSPIYKPMKFKLNINTGLSGKIVSL